MNTNYSFMACRKITFFLWLFIIMLSFQLKSQIVITDVIEEPFHVEIDLLGVPGFVESQRSTYNTSLENIEFEHWIQAERNGGSDFGLLITTRGKRFHEVNVFYHKDYGTPDQTTTEILDWSFDNTSLGFPSTLFFVRDLDLDQLDGTQMGVLEIVYENRFLSEPLTAKIPMVVTGARSLELPILGAMVTPQLPHIILHDPPGDGSFSTFKGGQTICRETTTSYEREIGAGATLSRKVGTAGEVSTGTSVLSVAVPFEASVEVTANFNMSETTLTENTTQRCLEITNEFNTSDLPGVDGEDADIFIGYGETWLYGIFEEIVLPSLIEIQQGEDSARVISEFAYARDNTAGSTTTFILTATGIQNDIETQMSIANDLSNSVLTRTRALNQVKVWQDVLDRNATNIATADERIGDYLFSGNTSSSFDDKITISQMTSLSIDVAIETSAEINAVVEVGGSGISGGAQINFNINEGITTTDAQESSRLVGYTFEDDDPSDLFNVSAFRDPIYGTPIFRNMAGTRTSCPYESGFRIDQPSLQSEDIRACSSASVSQQYIQTVNLNDPINIRLDVCNNSDIERDYILELVSNANNTIVELGGETIGSINSLIQYPDIAANDCWQDISNEKPLLTITRNPNSNVDNAVIVFNLYPACDAPGIQDEGSQMVLDITFGRPNPKADIDCDGCAQEIVLNSLSGPLNGTYVSEQKIIVQSSAQFGTGTNVTLDAPEVEVLIDNTIPTTSTLSVMNDGCQEN